MAVRKNSNLTKSETKTPPVVAIMKDCNKGGDNIKVEQLVKGVKPTCPDSIMYVNSMAGALSRPFNIGHFNSKGEKHLLIRGYVDFYGGYAQHTREVLKYLDETGKFCIKLNAIPSPRDIDPITGSKMDSYSTNPAFIAEGSTFLAIAGPGYMMKSKIPSDDRRKIGWTMIETRGVQPRIVDWLNNMDEIWAPTTIDKIRFEKAGVKNVHIVPLGYDTELYNTQIKPMNIPSINNRYVFGVVGSWNVRKGVKEIVQAYCRGFHKNDNVTLLLVCKYGTRKWGTPADLENEERWNIKYELEQYVNEIGMHLSECPHISIIDVPIHPNVLPTILRNINCLVGFSKGESTWLPGLELGAMQIPIIQLSSECSGFMDYLECNRYMCEEVTYKIADQELYEGTSEYYEGEELAHGNVEELSEMMIRVRKEKDSFAQITNCLNIYEDHIRKRNWINSTEAMLDRLLR